MQEAMDEVKMVVEGVYSAKAALALSRKYHVEMPIVEEVNQVLFEGEIAEGRSWRTDDAGTKRRDRRRPVGKIVKRKSCAVLFWQSKTARLFVTIQIS